MGTNETGSTQQVKKEEKQKANFAKDFLNKNFEIKDKSGQVIGYTINQETIFEVNVPYLQELCPIMEVFIYNDRQLIGIGQYQLSNPLAYFYKEEEDKQYVKKWYDFLKLGKN